MHKSSKSASAKPENPRQSSNNHEGEENSEESAEKAEANEKLLSYIQKLQAERLELQNKFPFADRLLAQEITNAKQQFKPIRDSKYLDVYREKPCRIITKVIIPSKEHPKFNFVGKLLGPHGSSFRKLQEETSCRMSIQGKGSMKDKDEEEVLRNSGEIKYAHLLDELHVEVSAIGPPSECYARMSYALAEIRKYLVPDAHDTIRQQQFKELLESQQGETHEVQKVKIPPYKVRAAKHLPGRPGFVPRTSVMSILDRARSAMQQSYEYEAEFYDQYEHHPPVHTHTSWKETGPPTRGGIRRKPYAKPPK